MQLGLSLPDRHPDLFDFVAVGEGSVDVISQVDALPALDEKTTAFSQHRLPGGQAATAAAGVARLGWRARWIGVIGDDDGGRLLRRALEQERVDVAACLRAFAATRSAMVFVDRGSGRRAIVESRDPTLNVAEDEISDERLCSGRIVLVDGTDMQLSLRAATAARRAGRRTMVDLDYPHPAAMQLLREIDVVILPGSVVHDLTGISSPGRAVASLAKALPQTGLAVATLGEGGAVGWCRSGEVYVPAQAMDIQDTTGAGDAFRAGFAARWLETGAGAEVLDLLEYAALVAGLSCRRLGAQTGLPTRVEVANARSGRV
jgi:ribokinase